VIRLSGQAKPSGCTWIRPVKTTVPTARHRHLEWASNDRGDEPDVVMACCGDVPTLETLAAVRSCAARAAVKVRRHHVSI